MNKIYEKKWQILIAVMIGSIMGPIDGSIVNVALPTITHFFGATVSTAQWVPMIYLLTISSLLLFYGRLGDIYGHEKLYLGGLSSFIISSVLCGLSPSIIYLILFRAFQGFTGGMMMAVSLAIITSAFPPYERGKALGINAIAVAVGLVVGPVLGGFITHAFGWQFIFFINVPIGLTSLIWSYRVLPKTERKPAKLDFVGALSVFVSLFCLLYLINYAQKTGFDKISVILGLIVGASFITFILNEIKTPQPMIRFSIFRNRTFSSANLAAFLNYMSIYILIFITPFYLQRVLHYTPDLIGLVLASYPLVMFCVSPISGALSDKIGTRFLAFIGAGICALALFFMSQLGASSDTLDVVWRLALFGLGASIFQPPNNSAVMGSAPREHLGVASGILATMRTTGMVFGISIAGMVLYSFVSPGILQMHQLAGLDAYSFTKGVGWVYLTGGALNAFVSILSLVRER